MNLNIHQGPGPPNSATSSSTAAATATTMAMTTPTTTTAATMAMSTSSGQPMRLLPTGPSYRALKMAVSALYSVDDFYKVKIGSGFFSEVYKVSMIIMNAQ